MAYLISPETGADPPEGASDENTPQNKENLSVISKTY
jgi:hypothetical protein